MLMYDGTVSSARGPAETFDRTARLRMDDTEARREAPGDVITVLLVEDNRMVREGIVAVLGRFEDIRVVATQPAPDPQLPADVRPDVVLIDLGLDPHDSLEVARQLIERFPEAGVVVMDLLAAAGDLVDYIGLGVSGFIMKDAPVDEVARTIRAVAAGDDVLPAAMTATLFSEIAREATSEPRVRHLEAVRLTPRESEVIDRVSEGMSNKAIARDLHISIHTVKSHLRNIMEKLNLHSRLQLARYADEIDEREMPTD
jgi:DNA-binding NarL/FixJ family response regulator